MCNRPTCRFVHLSEANKVEIIDHRVAVCRDHAKGNCKRQQCKYYHIPVAVPPAHVMANVHTNVTTTTKPSLAINTSTITDTNRSIMLRSSTTT